MNTTDPRIAAQRAAVRQQILADQARRDGATGEAPEAIVFVRPGCPGFCVELRGHTVGCERAGDVARYLHKHGARPEFFELLPKEIAAITRQLKALDA